MQIKGKLFPILLGLSALLVEACAAFFSVYGLSKLFSGASIPVIIMATSLETAKVVTASFLYRHWKTAHWMMKSYMTFGVLILITITSMGIYGFLSNAFQSSTVGIETQSAQTVIYEQEISRLTKDRETLIEEKKELQTNLTLEIKQFTISDKKNRYLDATYRYRATKRYQPQIDEKEKQLQDITVRLDSLNTKLSQTKVQMIQTGADVGPVLFVAKLFNAPIGTVVQYIIFIFIFVFDPLAVVLVIATNKAWIDLHPPILKSETGEIPTTEKVSWEDRRKLKELYDQWNVERKSELDIETMEQDEIPSPPPNTNSGVLPPSGMAPVLDASSR